VRKNSIRFVPPPQPIKKLGFSLHGWAITEETRKIREPPI
jgi:hypothetical protein